MKAIAAHFIFEANTFNPVQAPIERFTAGGTWLTDVRAAREWVRTTPTQLSGSLGVLEAAGWETVPVFVAVCSSPAGRLTADCFARIRGEMGRTLRAALPADMVLLHLHGAACAVGEDDVEGNLVAMVREELGYRGPLGVSLDLHANITRNFLRNLDAVTGYRTMPHIDFVETGDRLARLMLRKGRPPVRTMAKIAALIAPSSTNDREGPFGEMMKAAREMEKRPGIIDVGLYPVQPWFDVDELGTSVVVLSEDAESGRAAAQELATAWYEQRDRWRTPIRSWDEIRRCLETPAPIGPWILVDLADAASGGSTGRSAEALKQLLPRADSLAGEVLLWVVDPAAVEAASRKATKFRIGDPAVEFEATPGPVKEGRYRARGKSYTGMEFSMGRAAVLARGRLRVVVSEGTTFGADPAFYECLGLDSDHALAVLAKSPTAWRAGFGVTSDRGLIFDGPGCTTVDFARLPYRAGQRELFPFTRNPPRPITLWQSS